MKSLLSWILLAVYLNAAAQTLLPTAQDFFEHLFFWQDHLEHVHHGQVHSHHVADDTAAVAGESEDGHPQNEHPAIPFFEDNLSMHLAPFLPLLQMTVSIFFPSSVYPARDRFQAEVFMDVIVPPPDWA